MDPFILSLLLLFPTSFRQDVERTYAPHDTTSSPFPTPKLSSPDQEPQLRQRIRRLPLQLLVLCGERGLGQVWRCGSVRAGTVTEAEFGGSVRGENRNERLEDEVVGGEAEAVRIVTVPEERSGRAIRLRMRYSLYLTRLAASLHDVASSREVRARRATAHDGGRVVGTSAEQGWLVVDGSAHGQLGLLRRHSGAGSVSNRGESALFVDLIACTIILRTIKPPQQTKAENKLVECSTRRR
ncbi:hypothetical protein B0H14DRAFT_2616114 [Mycena olivaceomarginata]|nr:hypothetical protein B0H14DRAFT_2616114 [Mycena olivaceomarginata]